jgi:ribonuclease P protein component
VLPKPNRLKAKGEFKRTLSGRRLCSNQFFVLYGLAAQPAAGSFSVSESSQPITPPARPTRIGFIVSKKIHKRATKRNKIRRRLRELVRLHLQNKQIKGFQGYRAFAFIARPDALGANFQDLKYKMERCLDQIRPPQEATIAPQSLQ